MSRVRARGEEIRRFILNHVQANPSNISKLTMDHFGITRQAVNTHLHRLVVEGGLQEKGKTRGRVYRLAPILQWKQHYAMTGGPAEDVAWRSDVAPVLGSLPENVSDIWSYGFTEMFNNAREHSGGTTILVSITKTAATSEMSILDDGVGIFRKIQSALQLLDERHAIFELSKGKLTTDPARHTGEGIFFTSRVFDGFDILSGGVLWSHQFGEEEDWLLERQNPTNGTAVFLKLNNHTSRTLKRVFDQFTATDDDLAFSKTIVPVQLAQYRNDKLISRSQAKRVLARADLFKKVILDFKDVPTIGQAFGDEVFRVFPREHPGTELAAIHANSEVRRMILRAKSTRVDTSPTTIS